MRCALECGEEERYDVQWSVGRRRCMRCAVECVWGGGDV